LINPYTIRKSRTGGVISRLLSWGQLRLVAARMFTPSRQLVEQYAGAIQYEEPEDQVDRKVLGLIKEYLLLNYLPQQNDQYAPRVMLLLFSGEHAVNELKRIVGHITKVSIGETVRGTYGDFVERAGRITYFEPAVLIGQTPEGVAAELKIWARYSKRDGGLLQDPMRYPPGVTPERTLVLIKPDNFQEVSSRAGNIIDKFSQTGLFIVGARVIHMTLAQAEEFYAPIKGRLERKMKKALMKELDTFFADHLDFEVPERRREEVADLLKDLKTETEFNKIMRYMSGRDPAVVTEEERQGPGLEKCLALVYEGQGAVGKIRTVLGETNPEEAAPGTVRKDFGQDVIKNGAHASDSTASAERETAVIDIAADDITPVVESYYGRLDS
jgi:nucleoside diphosphate kinase